MSATSGSDAIEMRTRVCAVVSGGSWRNMDKKIIKLDLHETGKMAHSHYMGPGTGHGYASLVSVPVPV